MFEIVLLEQMTDYIYYILLNITYSIEYFDQFFKLPASRDPHGACDPVLLSTQWEGPLLLRVRTGEQGPRPGVPRPMLLGVHHPVIGTTPYRHRVSDNGGSLCTFSTTFEVFL